jgi:anti-sigma factor RsiW
MQSVDGELAPRRRLRVAQHLDMCRACRERLGRIRSTVANVEALYREQSGGSAPVPDYGRIRLTSAMREAAASEQPWVQRLSGHLAAVSVPRGLGVGLVVIATCAAALIAVRAATEPIAGGVPAGALPEWSLTPGAVSQLTTAELCNGVRPSRLVTQTVRQQVLRAYRMEQVPAAAYELDALITPELGGSTDPANLWPQRYHSPVWNARVKDELERLLPEMVCRQQVTLTEAQRAIASDWIAAYKRYFKTDAPLQSHLGPAEEEEAELLFVPGEPTMQVAAIRQEGPSDTFARTPPGKRLMFALDAKKTLPGRAVAE